MLVTKPDLATWAPGAGRWGGMGGGGWRGAWGGEPKAGRGPAGGWGRSAFGRGRGGRGKGEGKRRGGLGRDGRGAGGGPEHRHPNEQLGILLRGSMRFRIGDEERDLLPGGTWRILANVPHEVHVGPEGAVCIDVFSPPREDWRVLPDAEPRAIVWPAGDADERHRGGRVGSGRPTPGRAGSHRDQGWPGRHGASIEALSARRDKREVSAATRWGRRIGPGIRSPSVAVAPRPPKNAGVGPRRLAGCGRCHPVCDSTRFRSLHRSASTGGATPAPSPGASPIGLPGSDAGEAAVWKASVAPRR